MMGSFLTRGLVMLFGYLYPAYECFKTVEKNKPEIEQLRFWCQYWIIVAFLTVFERFGDAFVSWLPMYGEAKLAFIVYLWHPKTMGASYVYETFLRPYVSRHETEIDRNLLELRAKVGDMAVMYWQRAASYGQTRFFEVLQYVGSQSSNMHPQSKLTILVPQEHSLTDCCVTYEENGSTAIKCTSYFRPTQGAAADRPPAAEPTHETQPPPLRKAGSTTSQPQEPQPAPQPPLRRSVPAVIRAQESQQAPPHPASKSPQREPIKETIRSVLQSPALSQPESSPPQPQPASVSPNENQGQTTSSDKDASGTHEQSKQAAVTPSIPDDAGKSAAETMPEAATGDENAPATQDVVMEDAIRMTRARLRRTRTGKQIDI